MIERLGQVLYWTGCVFAALIFVGGALVARTETYNPWGVFFVFAVAAVVVWVIGRGVRYVLTGL